MIFTLGLLVTIAVVAMQNARAKAFDARQAVDVVRQHSNNKGNENVSLISSSSPLSVIAQVVYNCNDNKTIDATFYNGKSRSVNPGEPPVPSGSVGIILSDGRSFNLPQTISADGGRYASNDESFIFWSKGAGAFIEENNKTTFENCKVESNK